ncbi:MAG: hypothetical protein OEY10_00310 [Nitrosopumilus sp.]|nr:hypothetical protein [Nitrosopumilus sp.]
MSEYPIIVTPFFQSIVDAMQETIKKEKTMTTPAQVDSNDVLLRLGHDTGYYQALKDLEQCVIDLNKRIDGDPMHASRKWKAMEKYLADKLNEMEGTGGASPEEEAEYNEDR